VILVTGFNTSPTVEMETPFTKVAFTAFTILMLTQPDDGVVHVTPGTEVNTLVFAITGIFSTKTFPTAGDNVVGGVTHGHIPPLSTPRNIETGLVAIFFYLF
jgi:hypothetical protein